MHVLALTIGICLLYSRSLAENLTNKYFPDWFKLGVATSAYQIEGGWNDGGRGECIWDKFLHENLSRTTDGKNADIACDSYHKWREDIKLMRDLGITIYRFSISWSRILPDGSTNKVNQLGVDHYLNILKELQENNIEPLVTLYHSDLPQHLEDLGGWLNPEIADYFASYARLCFKLFGSYVKRWTTINEPKSTCLYDYGGSSGAPGLSLIGDGCYQCVKVFLLAHAKAYHIYDKEFRTEQGGKVSIVLDMSWSKPASDSDVDIEAAEREMEFGLGWIANPIYFGDWPQVMKDRIGNRSQAEGYEFSRLPELSAAEINYIKGTHDYFSLNYYTSSIVEHSEDVPASSPSFWLDKGNNAYSDPSWPTASNGWLHSYPFGLRKVLNYVNSKYSPGEIVITENGWADRGELDDQERLSYIQEHLSNLLDAILENSVNVVAYTTWSLLDNFEWGSGYTQKFGIISVDYNSPNRTRTWKNSGRYYQKYAKLNA